MSAPISQALLPTAMSDILQGAHDLVLNHPTFVNSCTQIENQVNNNTGKARPGLERLLDKSMRDAFHDSSARWPPPLCHPGTRQYYIQKIASWGVGASDQEKQILWVHGPAGIGKSAVAQSCANLFSAKKRLGAAVFLSRPNERNDPDRFFTSIAYQLAIRSRPFCDILDGQIQQDTTLVTKSIAEQFQDLLVNPISQLCAEGVDIGEWVVIVDGLDECREKEGKEGKEAKNAKDIQCDIIEIIATSVRENALPFRWVFLSRPESHIVASFTADNMHQILLHFELPVTRVDDNEIRLFLTDELQKIQKRSRLPDTWPPAHDIAILVNLSAGYWIYPAALVRFVRDHDSSPVDQLNAVLALVKGRSGKTSLGHPLAELDLFYTLIMRRVPSKILPIIQRILLLFQHRTGNLGHWSHFTDPESRVSPPIIIANLFGLSEMQFRSACSFLRSVLKFEPNDHTMTFYHASFMEFLADATRSNEFCVCSCLNPLRRELVERLNEIHARSTSSMAPCTPFTLRRTHPYFSRSSGY
ncbi:hypothetical protein P691DRAFT_710542 [Macrolepiota fuliginosa MF-IS2]|uniref:Nephrocystin 3-like N-terminal domain-containing protein n=1 Tax=Macrolepiota fuliginosa MF-IS2 TaxID=1400762 RepID=A0A9P5X758_9AGAR|nr:hypothetical protein P691DRAFT_710542 [Macrolepiota fuliginosa MF-IS2]